MAIRSSMARLTAGIALTTRIAWGTISAVCRASGQQVQATGPGDVP